MSPRRVGQRFHGCGTEGSWGPQDSQMGLFTVPAEGARSKSTICQYCKNIRLHIKFTECILSALGSDFKALALFTR